VFRRAPETKSSPCLVSTDLTRLYDPEL
jgi:hypothetical protein